MRKILAILAAALMLSAQTAFADNDTDEGEYILNKDFAENYKVAEMPKFSDEKDITKELDLLIRLNIISGYEDGTLKLNKSITRAEASRMFCYTVISSGNIKSIEKDYTKEGIEKIKKDYSYSNADFEYDGFDDVPMENWYHPYVYAAKNYGFINGYEDGTFRPENTVSEIEFLTMLERALGYSDMIEAEGGYPHGVTEISKRLKLIDNPSAVPATRGRAVTMLYNALHTNAVTDDGFAMNENGYLESRFSTTDTLLECRYMCKVHGTIKKSSLFADKTLVFVPDSDYQHSVYGIGINLNKGKEYTFVKEYSDITEGEHDVYIDYSDEEKVIIRAVL